ncbi:uncharacterized protein LOC128990398 [Macrosteles quadrilineatus]|uniref:uncharacterized protein LOC128990398 n=1 Tax=Macrosteles quadrilineatus TaxID=74068 RepID=UPI0023E1B580|nr:uncharacterized protein LOC128990398 [Macrosteles quadrilineatus]
MFRTPKSATQSSKKKSTNFLPERVVKKPKRQGLCKYSHRKCNLMCLEGYDYCLKHILEDNNSPYRPCMYLYTVSGKICGKPALRQERKDTWFCGPHNRKTQLQKTRASCRHAPPKTQETLFATLGHYVPPEQPAVKKEVGGGDLAEIQSKVVDPFVDIDASKVNNKVNQVLEYVSESDSDGEMAMLDSVWRAQDQESSDAESVDSQNEDPLKHAGTYTAEEVTIIIKDKMLRLQSLYIDQFRRLHHLLKEKRRRYLHTLKKEKETLCSIHDQEKQTAKEQKLYQKLKALNRYHKHHGVEAILHKKALELRAQVTEGHQLRTSHKGKCAFTEGGVKCGAKTLPVTKYCRKHILEDTHQVLFRSCGVKRDDHICKEPTLNVFENATCVYHTVLPTRGELGTLALKENQANETQESHNDRVAFVSDVDSEELLIKDILKPTGIGSGKSDSVDDLELSRTVSDILALAEAHSNPTDLNQITAKPFIEQSFEAPCNDLPKSVFDENTITSSKEIVKQVSEIINETSLDETNQPLNNQNLDTTSSETSEPTQLRVNSEAKISSSETPESVIEKNVDVSSSKILDAKDSGLCEKMDLEVEEQSHSPNKESSKHESSQDLMMVDMITDVGVVEEVLDNDLVSDSVEVVSSTQEVEEESCKQESDPDPQGEVRRQQVNESERKIIGPEEQEKLLGEQTVEEEDSEENTKGSNQQKRVFEYQIESEHQYAEMSPEKKKVIESDSQGVCSEHDAKCIKDTVFMPDDHSTSMLQTTSLHSEEKSKEEIPMEKVIESDSQGVCSENNAQGIEDTVCMPDDHSTLILQTTSLHSKEKAEEEIPMEIDDESKTENG